MNLADCYRVLGLRTGAPFADIKASYRRLARQYHPDVNPNDQRAKDKFIQVAEAYKQLSQAVPHEELDSAEDSLKAQNARKQPQAATTPSKSATAKTAQGKPTRNRPQVKHNPGLSAFEQKLKQDSYDQLQLLLRTKRYPRAIALVEGLAQRIAADPEIRQWQAIVYQRWGRQLIQEGQINKAKIYLKKALRTDPHNKSLWQEVEKELRRIKQMS